MDGLRENLLKKVFPHPFQNFLRWVTPASRGETWGKIGSPGSG